MSNKYKGESGGAWSEEAHLALHPENFNHGLARYIVNKLHPVSMLEFGSGLGHLAKYVVDEARISDVVCIEPEPIKGLYDNIRGPKLLQVDIFSDHQSCTLAKKYDLVVSIEVAEHIDRSKHKILFDFLVNHTSKWIVFSGARIGQGGHGHVAERNEDDWRSEFISRNMHYEEALTNDIRLACDKKNINHRKNLMIFTKKITVKQDLL